MVVARSDAFGAEPTLRPIRGRHPREWRRAWLQAVRFRLKPALNGGSGEWFRRLPHS